MPLHQRDGLPFAALTVGYGGQALTFPEVLVDTGSATTILAADAVTALGIVPAPADPLFTIRGVGGSEVVFVRRVEFVQLGAHLLPQVEIEVGGMDYGFAIQGILGMDLLTQARAVLDLAAMTLTGAPP